jgi:transcriptional regulator with XRE-family HTH domain
VSERGQFGTWLKQRRHTQGLTQADLARQIGCTVSAIKEFEAGRRRPSRRLAERLIDVLRVPAHERASLLRAVDKPIPRPRACPADRCGAAHSAQPVDWPRR